MISLENFINDLCDDMTSKLTTTIIAHENGKRPSLPFIVVGLISMIDEHDYDTLTRIQKTDSVDVIKSNDLILTLSFNIHTKDNFNSLQTDCLNYFKSDFVLLEEKYDLSIREITSINNRNNVLNAEYENISGFDVRIRVDNEVTINKTYIEEVQL